MNSNNFSKLYTTWTIADLLEIIDSPDDYQPLAVEVARYELESRQLTSDQIEAARSELETKHQDKKYKQQQVKDIEDKIKSFGAFSLDTFNPIQKNALSINKYIKLISLFLGGLFLYQLCKQFGLLKFMFTNSLAEWDISVILYFLLLIIIPTAGILFWLRKRHGWTLATLFFTYSAIGAIPSFLMQFNLRKAIIPELKVFLPTTSLIVYIGAFLIYSGLTWSLCKRGIRIIYKIDNWTMIGTIGLGIVIVILMTFIL
jgi:hypothetical protein